MAGSLGCRGMSVVNPRPEPIFARGEPGPERSDPDAGTESSPEGQRLFTFGNKVLARDGDWPRARNKDI